MRRLQSEQPELQSEQPEQRWPVAFFWSMEWHGDTHAGGRMHILISCESTNDDTPTAQALLEETFKK